MVSFSNAIRLSAARGTTLDGRACRSEFWWTYLALFLATVAANVVLALLMPLAPEVVVVLRFVLLMLYYLVSIPLMARRLHDLNCSGWWLLLSFVPVLNLAMLLFLCFRGTAGPNRFGPDPLACDGPRGGRSGWQAGGWNGPSGASGPAGQDPWGRYRSRGQQDLRDDGAYARPQDCPRDGQGQRTGDPWTSPNPWQDRDGRGR
ncbi:MAG: DUF805 domain-containing protein [Desulfovibrionaceae bacterium]|nr:DUF805 domain-containing protein [Desulfovibrionaceae bacterium]